VNSQLLIESCDVNDYTTSWYSVDGATGRYIRLYHELIGMTGAAFSADNSVMAYYREGANQPRDIWISSTNRFSPKPVTHINPFFDKYVFGKPRLISYQTADGEHLHAALLLPGGYVPGKRYPLIAYPYGSAYQSTHIDNFGFGEDAENTEDLQTLATRGFAILLPDAPVGTGGAMRDIAKTIVPGVQRAVALGYADPNRLGVMGHSFGGYTVMSLIAQTHIFRAAISRSGMSDWVDLFSELLPDGTAYGIQNAYRHSYGLGNDPWHIRSTYIANSPYYLFNTVTTPVLITHGTADTAVVPFNADMSFVALRHLHKDVAYAKYAGGEHSEGQWPFPDQLDYMNRLVNWFNRYLCPNRKSETEC